MSFVCAASARSRCLSKRFTSGWWLCSLMLSALFTFTLIRMAGVVSVAASPLAQPKSTRQVGLPLAATRAAIPADNLPTPEKVALGQRLFFDARLSADGTLACSTCHDPARTFGPKPVRPKPPADAGASGQPGDAR